jgi:hypothetical protein
MRDRLKAILTYSNVMATIAVFIALGAGAYAATTFVTPQGVIRGCVTKGGQITLLKSGGKCPKGRQPISWNQQGIPGQSGSNGLGGAPGAPGASGAKGSQGARGPSDGYVASLAEATGSATVSVAVPAGDYIAQGGCIASQVNGTKNGSAEADLTANNDPNHFDTQVATVPFTGREIFTKSKFGRVTLSTHTGFHLPSGGTISEKCGDEEGSEVANMSYNSLQVTAEQVGTLHG